MRCHILFQFLYQSGFWASISCIEIHYNSPSTSLRVAYTSKHIKSFHYPKVIYMTFYLLTTVCCTPLALYTTSFLSFYLWEPLFTCHHGLWSLPLQWVFKVEECTHSPLYLSVLSSVEIHKCCTKHTEINLAGSCMLGMLQCYESFFLGNGHFHSLVVLNVLVFSVTLVEHEDLGILSCLTLFFCFTWPINWVLWAMIVQVACKFDLLVEDLWSDEHH